MFFLLKTGSLSYAFKSREPCLNDISAATLDLCSSLKDSGRISEMPSPVARALYFPMLSLAGS